MANDSDWTFGYAAPPPSQRKRLSIAEVLGAKIISAIERDGWWILEFDNGWELKAESDSGKLAYYRDDKTKADCIARGMYTAPFNALICEACKCAARSDEGIQGRTASQDDPAAWKCPGCGHWTPYDSQEPK